MKKRTREEVFAAIGAAMAETRGRTLDKIDHEADAAVTAARRLVSITLQDYTPYPGAEPGDAEWRYRLALERALHGPLAVPGALRAFSLAQDSSADELTESERALAEAWISATAKARAEGMRGLADSHTAWFEVRSVRPVAPPTAVAVKQMPPAQPDLFH
ncbi:hypothetical protein [Xylophilus sp. GOD-11R]|uniref:hypothetical protein n=1 Tax=Xylophilus sp. GOD-11R TaxID=3089814 RepID=UPI00298C7166|nr:hypothetical protein [Xylophilus sp. GOD-11R]WPB58659.1 hypothetical protein R9X41_08485 [Xylophilus sp. GOD-11R]